MIERRESRTLDSGHQRLPLLSNATLEQSQTQIEYKTGACYKGQIQDNKKVGCGVFTWPNGAKYEGQFIDNARQGKGIQTFEDGTVYDGEFNEDMRHEQGTITWPNQESYLGKFFKDRRHGYGTYKWPDGSHYSGMFYMDRKEGYGAFHFCDSTKFEGLYKCDERFGPGVQTYPNGTQDVGLWHREKLVKLCGDLKGAFTLQETEFCECTDDQPMYIYPEYLQNRTDVIHSIMNPPEEFNYPPNVDIKSKTVEQIFNEALDARSLAVDIKAFDESFFEEAIKSRLAKRSAKSRAGRSTAMSAKSVKSEHKSAPTSAKRERNEKPPSAKKVSSPPSRQNSAKSQASIRSVSTIPIDMDEGIEDDEPILVWNKTPSCVAMQKHVIRHQPSEKNVNFSVNRVVDGDRSGFAEPGTIEQMSLEFLSAAIEGDANKVSDFMIAEKVNVDVADKSGHTALLGAAIHCHEDVINCLLDSGADVNKLNDEGISALAACHIFFYPSERFKYNIAEKEGQPPEDMEKEAGYDVNEAVKGLLSKKSAAATERKQTHEEKLEDQKITRLRKQYGSLTKSKESFDKSADINQNESMEQSILSKQSEKQLGTLKFKRAVRINVDDIMAIDDNPPESDRDSFLQYTGRGGFDSDVSDDRSSDAGPEEFASETSVRNYPIEISNQLIERCATALSTNEMVVGRARSAKSDPSSLGTVRRLAIDKREHQLMESTIRLLLRRGADPNSSTVPMPVLFFAVKAADVEAVRLLLLKGAATKSKLPDNKNGLVPLHIAVALPGEEGVLITELLLNSLADPDARALEDDSFLNRNLLTSAWSLYSMKTDPELVNITTPSRASLSRRTSRSRSVSEEEWSKDVISEESRLISGGRTPLHIACARDDNYRNACKVVHLLLDHHANPNLLCNGHSPLALAICGGNDLAIEELLVYQADPNLPLTHGVGSALCVASSTEYEHRRNPEYRLRLIDRIVQCGGDILAPIPIGPKRLTGTAVDYSYYMYNLDRRIAHMPYHALSHAERETYNARRKLLAHMGDILRIKAVERERQKLMYEQLEGRRSRSPSPNFVYMGAGQNLPPGLVKSAKIAGRAALNSESKVSFSGTKKQMDGEVRKPLLRYCYDCGRSVGVRLSACTRCKEVYYCSKVCKLKAWNARHKDECIRIGQTQSPGKEGKDHDRVDSPTPQTDADRGKANTLQGIMAPQTRIKLHLYPGASPNMLSGAIDPHNDLALQSDFQGQKDVDIQGGMLDNIMNMQLQKPVGGTENSVGFSKNIAGKVAVTNKSNDLNTKGLSKGKKLEYLGSIKIKDLKGKGQGQLKGFKTGKSPPSKSINLKNKKKAPLFIDPLTGLIKTIDPVTGKVIWMDNYSFV